MFSRRAYKCHFCRASESACIQCAKLSWYFSVCCCLFVRPSGKCQYSVETTVRIDRRFSHFFIYSTRRVRPPNGGRNEANSWETGSEYSSGETYTAAAMPAAGRRRPRRAPARRPARACGLARPAGPRWPLHAGIYQRRSRRIG